MAQVCRVPFGEVSGDRLQQLSSLKNRQNGIVQAAKASVGKRSYEMSMLEFDSENVDPAFAAGSKKSKSDIKPILFTPRLATPVKSSLFAVSERSLSTRAPAGRSPKRQPRSLFNKSFKRIDPPFATTTSTLPFSLDAALSNTVRKARPMQPKWDFKIYEDTPEEEAATVMEHSTLTLDLSSDDEAAATKKADRGKENTPPEDYVAPTSTRRRQAVEAVSEKMVEDDLPRAPLVDLPLTVIESEAEDMSSVDGAVKSDVDESGPDLDQTDQSALKQHEPSPVPRSNEQNIDQGSSTLTQSDQPTLAPSVDDKPTSDLQTFDFKFAVPAIPIKQAVSKKEVAEEIVIFEDIIA